MSYEDYRTGRPPPGPSNPSGSADFQHRPYPSSQLHRQRSDTAPTSPHASSDLLPSISMSSVRPAGAYTTSTTNVASSSSIRPPTTSAHIDNPYLTNAYASSRGGPSGAAASVDSAHGGGGGGPGPGMDYYGAGKPKGNLQGKLKDTLKNTMASVKSDNWKVVCVKATSHEVAAPKGKHVRLIMEAINMGSLSNRASPAGAVFHHLRKRMLINEWIVGLKAQTIFHHMFRDGSERFVATVATNARSIFKMEFFSDGSADGITHSSFIRAYGNYIEQWLAMKAAVKFPPGKAKEDDPAIIHCYRNSPIQDLLAAMPVLMDTLECMFKFQISGPTRFTPVALPALSMILRDLTIMWIALSEGMIQMLGLFFELEKNEAEIAFEIYKRFIAIVELSKPFFEMAKGLNSRWKCPELGAISLELIESMQRYIENGPEKVVQPQFSDEEEYEQEPEPEPEPLPDDYYEPEPVYYSEEEPDRPLERDIPHYYSDDDDDSDEESSEEEEEEDSSSSEDDAIDVLPAQSEMKPVNKPLDPLADLLGIDSGTGTANGGGHQQQSMALQVYGAEPGQVMRGLFAHPAGVDQSFDERVSNVKGMMAAANTNSVGQEKNGFGVTGSNMQQMAMYNNSGAIQPQQQSNQKPINQQQQQMYNTMAMQQQQQQLAAYQTMNAYQTMAHNQQQMVLFQQMQQQSVANGMNRVPQNMNGMHQMGMMGPYTPTPQGNQAVPVMQAQKATTNANFRVRKGTKPDRVNESDTAFGPLLDQIKKTGIGK